MSGLRSNNKNAADGQRLTGSSESVNLEQTGGEARSRHRDADYEDGGDVGPGGGNDDVETVAFKRRIMFGRRSSASSPSSTAAHNHYPKVDNIHIRKLFLDDWSPESTWKLNAGRRRFQFGKKSSSTSFDETAAAADKRKLVMFGKRVTELEEEGLEPASSDSSLEGDAVKRPSFKFGRR
jgi:hypothetical protein